MKRRGGRVAARGERNPGGQGERVLTRGVNVPMDVPGTFGPNKKGLLEAVPREVETSPILEPDTSVARVLGGGGEGNRRKQGGEEP